MCPHRQGVADSNAPATCHGPISQRQLLQSLGIEARLQSLLQHADADTADMLQTGYLRLIGGGASATASGVGRQKGEKAQEEQTQTEEEGMGLTYQAMAITAADASVPVGFE